MKHLLTAISISTLIASSALAEGLADVLPEKLFTAKGEKVDRSTLDGKYVGLYFSAHWCPPCRMFTPLLVDFRNKHAEDGFEVVFISADRSGSAKKNYMRESGMEWLTTRGAGSRVENKIERLFQIPGYPTLIVLGPDGKVVSLEARSDVMISPETAFETWKGEESS